MATDYGIQILDDGRLKVTISNAHQKTLLFIANQGGEVRFDWRLLTDAQRAHTKLLVEPMLALTELPIVGSPIVYLRLTDLGRNLVTMIADRVKLAANNLIVVGD